MKPSRNPEEQIIGILRSMRPGRRRPMCAASTGSAAPRSTTIFCYFIRDGSSLKFARRSAAQLKIPKIRHETFEMVRWLGGVPWCADVFHRFERQSAGSVWNMSRIGLSPIAKLLCDPRYHPDVDG